MLTPKLPIGQKQNPRQAQRRRQRRRGPNPSDGPYADGNDGTAWTKLFKASPFPVRKFLDVPSSYFITLGAAGGGLFGTAYSWRLNSLYDPEISLGLASPYQYSALASIWRAYRVHAVTIDLLFSDPSADGMYVAAGIYASNNTPNISGNGLGVVDQKQMVDMRAINNTGAQTVRITRRITIAQAEGMTKAQWSANPNYEALFGANPALYPVVNIAVSSAGGTPTCNVCVRITMHAECFGLVPA